ncbi:hypothetical protein CBM2609_B70269 [Cupriavidus taiwanensis]|nr:hypothetical protein CBM2604_B60268 [Cupriavidus taiwanensis]SOZ33325.1 hypothetical protein CBM2609_B70269 [Cupriavidus taiwanensis]SOZ48640.1 hypothetical protein CBM2610_B50269 [Cupriavidus taiwanensis]
MQQRGFFDVLRDLIEDYHRRQESKNGANPCQECAFIGQREAVIGILAFFVPLRLRHS